MNKYSLVFAWGFIGVVYSFGADFSTATITKDPSIISSLQASNTKILF